MVKFETFEELKQWQRDLIAREALNGEPLFLGIPDRWHIQPRFACRQGHVSTMALKAEGRGYVCLECFEDLIMVPPEIEE